MTTLYITRQFKDYVPTVKTFAKDCIVYPVDAKLYNPNIKYVHSDVAIIILSEYTCDRRTQKEWLETITKSICIRYKHVFCLMFCITPDKYAHEYKMILPKMTVQTIRHTIDDDYNQNNLSMYLKFLPAMYFNPTRCSMNESVCYYYWGDDNILMFDNNQYIVYHYTSPKEAISTTFNNLDDAMIKLNTFIGI